jgi:hypothetical protein
MTRRLLRILAVVTFSVAWWYRRDITRPPAPVVIPQLYPAWKWPLTRPQPLLRNTSSPRPGAGSMTLIAIGIEAWLAYRAFRRRKLAGCCPACGYDLRASPDRCPKCGRVVEQATAA